jgi:hypothetical protein
MAKKLIVTIIALISIIAMVLPGCGDGDGGGTPALLRISTTSVLNSPWNPVAGSNWAYDRFIQNAVQDMGVVPHPVNGEYIPWRIEKADVTVNTGLPVAVDPSNTGWCNLSFAATINVPSDTWADWNATSQTWITAGTGKTAVTKTVVYYPESIWDVKNHDGSNLCPADFMLYTIMVFDRAKPDSDIYDASYVDTLVTLLSHLKGFKLEFNTGGYGAIFTTYDDVWYLDAEWIVGGNTWYPANTNTLGEYTFETVSLGILAEVNGQLAFSTNKAETPPERDWMSFIGGPSLNILAGHLNNVTNAASPNYKYIPYAPTLNNTYITGAQALTRYQNLKTFYNSHHHFWVGTGPYYINTINTAGKVVDLKKFTSYNLPGDQFFDVMATPPTTPWPDITGGWVDEIVISQQANQAAAVAQLANNELDIFAYDIANPGLKATVDANPNLHYYSTLGTINSILLNVYNNETDPFFSDGRFNPFAISAVREALNKAFDRTYVVGTIMSGLAVQKFTVIGSASSDATRFAAELNATKLKYAYDFAAANATIYSEMMAIPLMNYTAGKYYYNGTAVEELVLIRNEDEKKQLGYYVAGQLEDLGFTVNTLEGASADLWQYWLEDPSPGTWDLYTAAWGQTGVSRDEGGQFGYFYTSLGSPYFGPLWDAYTPTPAFDAVVRDLFITNFTTVVQRDNLFRQAINMSMENSCDIWMVERAGFEPLRKEVAVGADAAAGILSSYLWAVTVHFQDSGGVPIAPAT